MCGLRGKSAGAGLEAGSWRSDWVMGSSGLYGPPNSTFLDEIVRIDGIMK